MEQFDKMLKEMAEKEEMIVPNGFDERLQNVLDDLPAKTKKRGLGIVKGVLIAAAACAALLCTAFAASPGLRGMLAEALGGFAPYAHDQEDQAYAVNEFEYQVLSALTDGTTVRIYVQQRDLVEGRNSTEETVCVLYQAGSGGYFDTRCISRDESTGTSLWCLTRWGRVMEGSEDLSLFVGGFAQESLPEEGAPGMFLPLELELMPSIVIAGAAQADQLPFHAEELRLSPLGLTAVTRDNPHHYDFDPSVSIRVCLTDGTEVAPEQEAASGQGTYGSREDPDSQRKVIVWNFREPVDVENIEGIYVGEQYFPVK